MSRKQITDTTDTVDPEVELNEAEGLEADTTDEEVVADAVANVEADEDELPEQPEQQPETDAVDEYVTPYKAAKYINEQLGTDSGWVEIPRFNDEVFADHWFEKRLA